MTDPPAPQPLATRRVELRVVTPADYPFLYTLATNPAVSYRWRYRGGAVSPEQFAGDIWQGVLTQYLVVHPPTQQPVGLQSAYQADLANRTCYLALLGDPQAPTGLMMEGALLFVDYLFETWDLRQIYAEVPGYTYDNFASGAGRYFVEEGRLRDHSYHGGRYWDLHLLAVHRDTWQTSGQRLLHHLTGSGRHGS